MITAITHQNATAEMTLQYRYIIITAARTVDIAVIYIQENVSWERLMNHAVPLVWVMRQGTEGLQTLREEFEAENKGTANSATVRLLAK